MQELIDEITKYLDLHESPEVKEVLRILKASAIRKYWKKEKEQITKAWDDGDYAYFYNKETGRDFENGEEYYENAYCTKEINNDKYSIFDCHGMIISENYSRNMTFEKAKNLINKLNEKGDGFAPYTMEKTQPNL